MIELMIAMVRKNKVKKEQQLEFQKRRFDPFELLKLKRLNREELLSLMVFCEIRVMNETPVVAMTDDELRMAYLLWRANGQTERVERQREAKRRIRILSRAAKEFIQRSAVR